MRYFSPSLNVCHRPIVDKEHVSGQSRPPPRTRGKDTPGGGDKEAPTYSKPRGCLGKSFTQTPAWIPDSADDATENGIFGTAMCLLLSSLEPLI